MRTIATCIVGFFMGFMILSLLCMPILAQNAQDKEGHEVGNRASDFSLPNTRDEQVRLSSYKGSKNVVLIFYRGEF